MTLATVSLHLQATPAGTLLGVLTVAVCAVMLVVGVGQWVRGRRIVAVLLLAGAVAPSAVCGLAAVTGEVSGGLWYATLTVGLLAASVALYVPAADKVGVRPAAVLAGLRCVAVMVVLGALFKPALTWTTPDSGHQASVAVVVDRSGSMTTQDTGAPADRYAMCLQALATQHRRLDRAARVRWVAFSQRPQNAEDFAALRGLAAGGEKTDLSAALAAAVDAGKPGAIVFLSDGIHTAGGRGPAKVAAASNVPVWAVGVGDVKERPTGRNLRVLSAQAPTEAAKDNVTTVTVRVEMSQLARTPMRLELIEAGRDRPVATLPLQTEKDLDVRTVKLQWTPRPRSDGKTGPDVRRLKVVAAPAPGEASADDNSADVHVLITQPEIRVLYVEGAIRPEYKFLRRLLDSDPNVIFSSLVRISEDRFLSYSREAGAPTSLPTAAGDFARIDVLVLGSLDRTFLGAARMAQIRQFVDGGGGLLMLGGRSSFAAGNYGGTDVEAALPVVMGSAGRQDTTSFLPVLTSSGRRHPVLQGLEDFFSIPGRSGPKVGTVLLPPLDGCVEVERSRPGTALAVHPTRRNAAGPLVILAAQQYGKGRSIAMTADTTWKWQFQAAGTGEASPYSRLWGQMIRWLARGDATADDASSAVVMQVDRPRVQTGQDVTVRARVQNAQGLPADDAKVTCEVSSPDASAPKQTLTLARRSPGLYEAPGPLSAAGANRLTVRAADATGKALGADEMTVRVQAVSGEMQRLARDERMLRRIAESSGGRYADLSALPEVVDEVLARAQAVVGPTAPATVVPVYSAAWAMILFALLLTAELLLRRRWQLR